VRRVDVEEADGDRLHLGLTMRGDRALLARIVELGNVLGIASATAGGVETDFVYSR